ncbi:rab11 family-interacting protein 2 isoform X3 [Arvicola amphibius]|uniref:rab11 family-interacting protein 2 isoform X3 n=1 Tax=Arvicola amphibius TaxID=1047088 RepID=UPI0018E30C02|nr:rab11 family-interacting protein 2 isoform X3 [Arvicola amphibius]
MMLSEQAQKWFPTHVQVTVLQAKDLKPKGKSGTNDTYTIIQLGKEKYSTSVAEKTLEPVWKEEASFELPGLLMQGNPEKYILFLIVMHRSLVGLDKFLGQVAINLNDIFEDKQRRKTDTHMPDASAEFPSSETQMKSKPRKPFLLGPQRLSSAHSMSDLTGSHLSSEKLKSSAVGPTHLLSRQIDSFGVVPESGSLKSPHRRTLSFDTSKLNHRGSIVDEGDPSFGRQSDPFTNVTASLPQKFATLPRKKNPFEESSESWDSSVNLFSKPAEVRKENKREKREKVSLFERVTGKKDSRRSEKLNNGGSDSPCDLKSPSAFNENRQDYFDYESTNPFTAKFRASTIMSSSSPCWPQTPLRCWNYSFHMNPTSSEDLRKIPDNNPFDATAGYRSLTYEEVLQELVKHKELLRRKDTHIRELEDYIDNLLVRVMEETPSILRVPYEPSRKAGKFSNS